jgi:hypothetical protein
MVIADLKILAGERSLVLVPTGAAGCFFHLREEENRIKESALIRRSGAYVQALVASGAPRGHYALELALLAKLESLI